MDSNDFSSVAIVAEEPLDRVESASDRVQPPETGAPVTRFGRSIYRQAALACLGRWVRVAGFSPYHEQLREHGRSPVRSASRLHRQQSAATALGLLAETETGRADGEFLHECVRTALISWQMSLRCDGFPVSPALRRSPLPCVSAFLIIQLLNETSGFQTAPLLADAERHVRLLAARRRQTPWVEAALAAALAEGAVLFRDTSLLGHARRRVKDLLEVQDEEGWFPERGGADVGRLSLTLDALARSYRQNEWGELEEPIRRTIRFLGHFVRRDGRAGGCYSSCGTAFISPYGPELMTPVLDEAVALAQACRRRYESLAAQRFCAWHDGLCALLGPAVVLAARCARPHLPEAPPLPSELNGVTHFPSAGLHVYATDAYHAVAASKFGGAVHVEWKSGANRLEEPGITVVTARGARSSARWDPGVKVSATASSIECRGALRQIGRRSRSRSLLRGKIGKLFRNVFRPGPRKSERGTHSLVGRGRNPSCTTKDTYEREIVLENGEITIRDRVRLRHPCQSILLRHPQGAMVNPYRDCDSTEYLAHEPIFVDGGNQVEMLRTYRDGVLMDQRNANLTRPRRRRGG